MDVRVLDDLLPQLVLLQVQLVELVGRAANQLGRFAEFLDDVGRFQDFVELGGKLVPDSLVHDDSEYPAPALVHVDPQDSPFTLRAGKDGLEAMALNFSRAGHDVPAPDAQPRILSRWQCLMCQFTYYELDGRPDENIAAGTRWEGMSDDWACPHCASPKREFRQI